MNNVVRWIKNHKIIFAVMCVAVLLIGGTLDNAPAEEAPVKHVAAKKVDPLKELSNSIKDGLGRSNRDIPRVASVAYNEKTQVVLVKWSINEQITSGLIKAGARHDIVKILKEIKGFSKPVKAASLVGTYALEDKYGNSEEAKVVRADYSKTTLGKINTKNISPDDIYDVSDSYDVHPAFQ